jgi:hypothetical protein
MNHAETHANHGPMLDEVGNRDAPVGSRTFGTVAKTPVFTAAATNTDPFYEAARVFWPQHADLLYRTRDEVNRRIYGGALPPIPVLVGLTPHGHALGYCDLGLYYGLSVPRITMHPSTLTPASDNPWQLPANELNAAFLADVLTHELIHAWHALNPPTTYPDWCPDVHSDDDTHSNPFWCEEVMRQSPIVGVGVVTCSPWRRKRTPKSAGGGLITAPVLAGSITRQQSATWPASVRPVGYYRDSRPWFDRETQPFTAARTNTNTKTETAA